MAQINLLPWREERRQALKQSFLVTLGLVAALGFLLVLLGDQIMSNRIDNQNARNAYLTKHIKELDKQVREIRELERRRKQLLERMEVIQRLQGNRPIIVRVLDQLVRTVPDGVFYTNLKTKGKTITINGLAESNNRVSSLMRQLDASDWLANPNLDKVNAAPNFGDQATKFNLTVKVQAPASGEEAEKEAEKG